jgi:hypothetical protein
MYAYESVSAGGSTRVEVVVVVGGGASSRRALDGSVPQFQCLVRNPSKESHRRNLAEVFIAMSIRYPHSSQISLE